MPSRNSRLKNRRVLTGGDSSATWDNVDNVQVLHRRTAWAPAAAAARSSSSPQPSRLRRLLVILVLTTTLLALYHAYRLYARGDWLQLSSADSFPFEVGTDATPIAKRAAALDGSANAPANVFGAGSGMVVHHTANDEHAENSDIRLENLDMETLQAAFDALYGDGGPLGPRRKAGGEEQYRVQHQGKKESLN